MITEDSVSDQGLGVIIQAIQRVSAMKRRRPVQYQPGVSFPRQRQARSSVSPYPPPVAARPKAIQLFKRPAVWVFGVVATALGSVMTGFISGLLSPWVQPSVVIDNLNQAPPVSAVAIQHREENGWVLDGQVTVDQMNQYAKALEYGADVGADYLESIGAWPRGLTTISLVLKSERQQPVKVIRLSPEQVECRQAPTGSLIFDQPEGEDGTALLAVSLDSATPDFIDPTLPTGGSRGYFTRHTFDLQPGEVLPITIEAYAQTKACEWRIAVDTITGDKTEHFLLNAGAASFRVAAGQPDYDQVLAPNDWTDAYDTSAAFTFVTVDKESLCRPDCTFPLISPFNGQ